MDKDLRDIISDYIYSQVKVDTEENREKITEEVYQSLSKEISVLNVKIPFLIGQRIKQINQ